MKESVLNKWCFICVLYWIFIGCSCTDKGEKTHVIRIDVSKDYPEKEILLSEIADVRYVCMNEGDEYIYGGSPLYVSDNTFVFYSEGSFLFFSKEGEPKSRFNHQGNGPGEYSYFSKVLYDEANDEFYVLTEKKLIVYSSSGVHKRTFALPLPDDRRVMSIALYDETSLVLYDSDSFLRISKADGSELERINVSSGEKVQLYLIKQNERGVSVIANVQNTIVKYQDGLLLSDFSTDTVFYYNKERELLPVLLKEPGIHTLEPTIYANAFVEAGEYWFYRKIIVKEENGKLPSVYLMQNKEDGSIYEQKIMMDEFKGKQVRIAPEILTSSSRCGVIELDLLELEEAYDRNLLSGKLKEFMEKVDRENDNTIYALLTFK